jgi:TP901 family phage tail tape measure protein
MGGFSLGDLFGSLRLDDTQFTEALNRAGGASNLFKINLDNIGASVINVLQELNKAGFSLQEFADWQGKVRDQGYSAAASVRIFAQALEEAQTRARELSRISIQNGSELENYRAKAEAERLTIQRLKEKYAADQDYAKLTKRLRDEQSAGEREQRNAAAEGARQEREYKAKTIADAKTQEQDYANLVNKLRAEEVKANNDARTRIEADAKKFRDAKIAQQQADVQAMLRQEKDAEDERRRQQQAAQAKERAMFFEHRRQMQAAQAATTIGVTLGAAGGAGLAAGGIVGNEAAHFQDAMSKSLAVIGDISDQMRDRLAAAARNAAKETGLAAKEIAEDYAIAAKGGLTAAQSLEFVPKAAKFAVATNSELHESTRQIITIMEALQLPASSAGKVMDELTVANQLARGSVDQLATALEGKSGAALRSANVSLEEALALTTAFSKAGVTASQSQTFLTQVVERLTYAARQYGNEQVHVGDKVMKFHDIVYQSDGTVRPFIQTLKLLDTAFQGKSANAIGKFFDDIHLGSARGAQALKILLSQSDMLDMLTTQFTTASDAMVKAFDLQMQSPLRQLERLKANLVDIGITLGIPVVSALQSVAKALDPVLFQVQQLAAAFSNLPQPVQTGIMSVAGFGAMSLVASGGILVMLGHIIRLQADIKLLTGMEGFAGLAATMGPIVTRLGVIGIAIAGITAATAAFIKEYSRIKESQEKNGPRADNLGIGAKDSFYGFGYAPGSTTDTGPVKESIEAHRRLVAQAKSDGDKLLEKIGKVETDNSMDHVRELLEQFRKSMKEAMDGAELAFDPEKALRKSLTTEGVRQKFEQFSDQYNQIVDKLSGREQEVIASGAAGVGKLLASGADPRVVLKALDSLELDLKRFKADAAQRDREDQKAFAADSASAQVQAFRERYVADMHTFTSEQQALIEDGIRTLEDEVTTGTRPKQIAADLKVVESAYTAIKNQITDATRLQKDLDETQRRYEASVRRSQKEKPDILPASQRVDPIVAQRLIDVAPIVAQGTKVENAMRAIGQTSQFAMTLAAKASEGLYRELKTLSPSVDELRTAWLATREAEIRADEGLKPLHDDMTKVHMDIERIKAEGSTSERLITLTNLEIQTKALDYQLNGVGKTYRSTLGALSGGFNQLGSTLSKSIMQVKDFGKIWKETLLGIVENVMGVFLQGLINMGAAWIAKSLGIAAVTKGVAASQVMDAAVVGQANAMASIAMIPIVGPALAPAAGELMFASILAASLPKLAAYSYGGEIDKDKIAMVHSGEYVMTSDLTKGLKSLVAQGSLSGGGVMFNFAGAQFGPKLTKADVREVMGDVMSTLRRGGARTIKGARA